MEHRTIYLASIYEENPITEINDLISEGFVLNPDFGLVRFENSAVYHLVKYTDEELEALKGDEELDPEIASIRSVAINDADQLIEQGYTVKDTFAKTVTLIKYAEVETETEIEAPKTWTQLINEFIPLKEKLPEELREDYFKATSLLQSLASVAERENTEQ